MKKISTLFLLLILILLAPVFSLSFGVLATDYTAKIGDAQLVYSNTISTSPFYQNPPFVPDGPYFIYRDLTGKLRGVYPDGSQGNWQLKLGIDPFATNLHPNVLEKIPGLDPGPAAFNLGGSWLYATYTDPSNASNILHGYYHAEPTNNWPYRSASIAYTYLTGSTWVKPQNNQIITSPDNVASGNHDLIVFGDYLYLFYDHGDASRIHNHNALARSKLTDKGKPGTWKKYYCQSPTSCDFTEPGLGGKDSPVPGLDYQTEISFNSYLGKYLVLGGKSTRGGTNLELDLKIPKGDDLLSWKQINNNQPIPLPSAPSGFQYMYGSIVPIKEDLERENIIDNLNRNITGKQFWFYYVQVQDFSIQNSDSRPRTVWRRLITLQETSNPTCQKSAWQNVSCGGTCKNGEMKQTRTVTPSGCATNAQCTTDISCNAKKGDADGNKVIDKGDFQIWKTNFLLAQDVLPNDFHKANFNSDNKVDGSDYAIWFSNFGK